MTSITTITDIADKGYIDEREMVKAVIDEFVNMPIGEIFNCVSEDRSFSFGMLQDLYEIDERSFENLTFLELLCLINNLHREEYSFLSKKGVQYSASELKMFFADMLRALLIEAQAQNPLIRLVLGLNITAMFGYLISRCDDRMANSVYRRIFSRAADVEKGCIKMNCTALMNFHPEKWEYVSIGEILKDINHACGVAWRPWWGISDYRMVQLTLRNMEGDILIRQLLSQIR